MDNNKIIEKIDIILKDLRTFINQDGGDVQFVGFDKGILTLKIMGACVNCPHINVTYDEGIKRVIMDDIPEVRDIVFIS